MTTTTNARLSKKGRLFVLLGLAWFLVCVTYVVIAPPAKYLLYMSSAQTRAVLNGKGREVELDCGLRKYRGRLVECHFRLNDKWGFFDLLVEVDGPGGSITTGLSPADVSRIRFVAIEG